VFAEDGTYTKTVAENYTADVDGDYRDTVVGAVTTSFNGEKDDDAKISGLANMPVSSEVISGKWISYDRQDNSADGVTLEYEIIPTSYIETTYGYWPTHADIAAATGGSTDSYSYTKGGNSTESNSVENWNVAYKFQGTNAAGKDMVEIDNKVYVQQ